MNGAAGSIGLHLSGRAARERDRLSSSDGIIAADSLRHEGYEQGAWVPKPPFRAIEAPAPAPLRERAAPARTHTVGLIVVEPRLLERLRCDAQHAQAPGALSHHLPELLAALSAEWDVVRAPTSLSVGRSAAGLPTVTRDPDTHEFVGLHVDTFRESSAGSRSGCGNRVSVNIGAMPRYFLFIPLSFPELFSRCGARAAQGNLVRQFLAHNPQQPVWRLKVNPGEAYIAPTESLIHDASSPPGACEDLHVTGRGVIDPRP